MAPQAFIPIHRRPKSELKGPNATSSAGGDKSAPIKAATAAKRSAPVKTAKTKASAFPVLPALAATLLVLGGVQATLWWWNKDFDRQAPVNVMNQAPRAEVAMPQTRGTLNIPVLPQNLQFGDVLGRVTVTILSDPSCGTCRAQVRELIAPLPAKGVRYVYKFWPSDPSRATPGLLMELARREGVVAPFWTAVQASGTADLDDTALLHLLDGAGVPLTTQRDALAHTTAVLTQALEPDLRAAATANLPAPPVLIVNTTVMDTASLTPTGLNQYVTQLLSVDTPEAATTHTHLRQMLPSR